MKSAFERNLRAAGIAYIHCKTAGNPSAIRKTSKDIDECMRRYRNHLAENPSVLEYLFAMIRRSSAEGRPASLTCYEREFTKCHRVVLMEELVKLQPQLISIHLDALA